MPANKQLGEHAIVIGGSMMGLLAGRVLSDYFAKVTILERDNVPETSEPRKGVPQGRHVHTLYGAGADVIERLLPGIWDDLVRDGATRCDFAEGLAWYHQGVWKLREEIGLRSYWMSRPFLESRIRERVRQISNVQFTDQVTVSGLMASDDRSAVQGVRLTQSDDGNGEVTMEADLVIDAAGRGSQSPGWLESLGYERPKESTVEVDLSYSSRMFERPTENGPDWTVLGLFGTAPGNKRTGYIFPIEGNRWMASCVGFHGDQAPDDDEGWLEYAKSLERPDFYEAIRDAKPLTPISVFKFPGNRRRHYERLSRFPDGLLVLGDAVCSFNPIYGQGMCGCAVQAGELQQTLDKCPSGNIPTGTPKRFMKHIGNLVGNPWLLATSADFLYPQTKGKRPFGTRLLLWYLVQLLELSSCNKRVLRTFHEVLHYFKTPAALFHPYLAFQAIKWGLGLRGGQKPVRDRQSSK
jgi:2-polyprenyl-6-methoxyphenol hydroxylase-like FAD-dependent oxidoreductase